MCILTALSELLLISLNLDLLVTAPASREFSCLPSIVAVCFKDAFPPPKLIAVWPPPGASPPILSMMNVSEYWIISAPGDKTCQQTWDRLQNVRKRKGAPSTSTLYDPLSSPWCLPRWLLRVFHGGDFSHFSRLAFWHLHGCRNAWLKEWTRSRGCITRLHLILC